MIVTFRLYFVNRSGVLTVLGLSASIYVEQLRIVLAQEFFPFRGNDLVVLEMDRQLLTGTLKQNIEVLNEKHGAMWGQRLLEYKVAASELYSEG